MFTVTRALRVASLAALFCLGPGCAWYPARQIPTDNELAVKAKAHTVAPQCSESLKIAQACADLALDALADMEANAGNWDRTFAYALVGLGTAAAIAANSNKDQSHRLENLAIATGSLVGIRSVVRPEEQRALAANARKAIRCMRDAADVITKSPGETPQERHEAARVALNLYREKRERADQAFEKADAHERDLSRAATVPPEPKRVPDLPPDANEAQKQAWTEEKNRFELQTQQRNAQLANAESTKRSLSDARRDVQEARMGQVTAAKEFDDATYREAEARERADIAGGARALRLIKESLSAQLSNAPEGARRVLESSYAQQYGAAGAQIARLDRTNTALAGAAKEANDALKMNLARGVADVLDDVRAGLARAVDGIESLAQTQRSSIEKLLGDLKEKAEEQENQQKETSGTVPPLVPDDPAPAQQAIAAMAEQGTDVQKSAVKTLYDTCHPQS